MAQLVKMPQLGSTMEEGVVVRWLKAEGDVVSKGEALLEVETDKATVEVECPESGVLRSILAGASESVAIHTPIAVVGAPGEPIDHLLQESASEAAGSGHIPQRGEADRAVSTAAEDTASKEPSGTTSPPAAVSPRARRLAEEAGIAVSDLPPRGSGPGGRVLEADVRQAIEARKAAAAKPRAQRPTPMAARLAEELGVDLGELALGLPGSRVRRADVLSLAARPQIESAPAAEDDYEAVPLSLIRRRVGENVCKSAFTAPHVTLQATADMEACAQLRKALLAALESLRGIRLTYTDILVKVVAAALQAFPAMNSTLCGEEIRRHRQQNIGVAVALEEGLIVPVVCAAGAKPLGDIAVELKSLVERARSGACTPEDLAGGTFTITNLGAYGIDAFDPILVPGQAGILGVGRIAQRPAVVDGTLAARLQMPLCLSFDHRIVDGAPAAQFLGRVKELLENPALLVL